MTFRITQEPKRTIPQCTPCRTDGRHSSICNAHVGGGGRRKGVLEHKGDAGAGQRVRDGAGGERHQSQGTCTGKTSPKQSTSKRQQRLETSVSWSGASHFLGRPAFCELLRGRSVYDKHSGLSGATAARYSTRLQMRRLWNSCCLRANISWMAG